MDVNVVSGAVVDAAVKVHTALGPGLLESAYEACLAHELRKRGHGVRTQVLLPVCYDGEVIDAGYRIDIVVDDLVIVELKAVEEMHAIYTAQIISYLKLSGKPVGLLINFHMYRIRDGIQRFANTRTAEAASE